MVTPTTAPSRAPAHPARVMRAPLVGVAEAADDGFAVDAGAEDEAPEGLLVGVTEAEVTAGDEAGSVDAAVARGAVDCPAI